MLPSATGTITEHVVSLIRGPYGSGLEIAVGLLPGVCQVTHVPPETLDAASGDIQEGDIIVDVHDAHFFDSTLVGARGM